MENKMILLDYTNYDMIFEPSEDMIHDGHLKIKFGTQTDKILFIQNLRNQFIHQLNYGTESYYPKDCKDCGSFPFIWDLSCNIATIKKEVDKLDDE